nr:NADH dehydrogenase subunit 3 [Semimytilus algosus]
MSVVSLCFVIPVVLSIVSCCLSVKSLEDGEKSSPYECGFMGAATARTPFSTRFFLVAVIFVVFDVEMVLLVPMVYSAFFLKTPVGLVSSMAFLVVLLVGLFHEYREGSLEWVK